MTVTLKRIQVSGFKSIREMDLELTSLNVLIGANGAGKSNFIGVFRLLNAILEKRLASYSAETGANSLLYFGSRTTDKLKLTFHFPRNGCEFVLKPSNKDTLLLDDEILIVGSSDSDEAIEELIKADSDAEDFQAIGLRETVADEVIDILRSWKTYHFQDTSSTARMKLTGDLNDNRFLRADGANLAAFLYLLQERYAPFYDRIVRTIRLVAPFFDNFVLAPSKLNPDKIRLEWRERGSDQYFDAHTLSDGTLRFICLTTLLLQPEPPSLILIDEPELGLHPYALNHLAGMIRSVSTQTQIIISTQSVTLLNQFVPENVIVVDREDRQSVFKRLSSEELSGWLDEYSLGELWEKNVLGGRRQPQEP